MARYTGPKHKLARREGVNVIDKTSASLQRRLNIPPGIHGRKGRRRRSEFGQQLREKQKAKAVYGLMEKQFSSLVKGMQKKKGDTGEMIIQSLETRLDNVVYRLGFAKTRYQARQFVTHGHVLANGAKVTIPSYKVKPDDKITLSAKLKNNVLISKLFEEKPNLLPFLERKDGEGSLVRLPKKEDLEVPFDIRIIIEYYSR